MTQETALKSKRAETAEPQSKNSLQIHQKLHTKKIIKSTSAIENLFLWYDSRLGCKRSQVHSCYAPFDSENMLVNMSFCFFTCRSFWYLECGILWSAFHCTRHSSLPLLIFFSSHAEGSDRECSKRCWTKEDKWGKEKEPTLEDYYTVFCIPSTRGMTIRTRRRSGNKKCLVHWSDYHSL